MQVLQFGVGFAFIRSSKVWVTSILSEQTILNTWLLGTTICGIVHMMIILKRGSFPKIWIDRITILINFFGCRLSFKLRTVPSESGWVWSWASWFRPGTDWKVFESRAVSGVVVTTAAGWVSKNNSIISRSPSHHEESGNDVTPNLTILLVYNSSAGNSLSG